MKKVFVIALLVIGLGLTAFAADKVTVQLWMGLNDPIREALEYFREQNPDINLVVEDVPAGMMREKVLLALAAGTPPDVLHDYTGRTFAWANQGFLEPLEDTLTEQDYEDYVPGLIELNTIGGHFVGYPRGMTYRVWDVNKTLCERAGVADLLPTEPGRNWTLEAYMKVATAIRDLGVYPFGFFAKGPSGDYFMLTHFQVFGASLYENGDYTKITLNSEAGVRALQWMIDMVGQGYAPKGVAGICDDDFVAMKNRGQIAIGGWGGLLKQRQLNFENGIIDYVPDLYPVSLPHIEGVPGPPAFVAWNSVVVFKGQSPERLAASKRLARFIGSKKFFEFGITPRAIPAWKSYPNEYLDDTGKFQLEWISVNGVGDLGYASPFYLQVRDLQSEALQAAFMGLKRPKEALDDFAEAVAKLWEDD